MPRGARSCPSTEGRTEAIQVSVADLERAADLVGRYSFNQPPALLRHALTEPEPLDLVTDSRLAPRKPDFDMVRDLMVETGVLSTEGSSSTSTWTAVYPIKPSSRPPGSASRGAGELSRCATEE